MVTTPANTQKNRLQSQQARKNYHVQQLRNNKITKRKRATPGSLVGTKN
jgi:hypothetical protein